MAVLNFGSVDIKYEIIYSDRKTLGITVDPELNVFVKAPVGSNPKTIQRKLRKRAPWILKQQDFFMQYHPRTPARRFVSGETHLYLGRRYQLRVVKDKMNEVRYKGRYIEVTYSNQDSIPSLMNLWYRDRAKLKFAEIAEPWIQKFKKYKVEPSSLYIQEMKTRWGSCTPKGKIILNPELIKAPKACIEYVIVHELCHLVHRDHTEAFFNLQAKEMPDWKRWKEKLERVMV